MRRGRSWRSCWLSPRKWQHCPSSLRKKRFSTRLSTMHRTSETILPTTATRYCLQKLKQKPNDFICARLKARRCYSRTRPISSAKNSINGALWPPRLRRSKSSPEAHENHDRQNYRRCWLSTALTILTTCRNTPEERRIVCAGRQPTLKPQQRRRRILWVESDLGMEDRDITHVPVKLAAPTATESVANRSPQAIQEPIR